VAAPISNKVASGTLTGAALTVLTWALTTYIPAWHHGLPATFAALLPGIVGAAGYYAGGYMAKHYPAAGEITQAALKLLADAGLMPKPPDPPGAVRVTKPPPPS
jgi:hypothetical protein